MQGIRRAAQRIITISATLLLVGLYPAPAILAAESQSSPATSSSDSQGPTQPTGPDAKTYLFNKVTGMWENDHYIWNPATNQTTPKDKPTYSYNPKTGMWDTDKFVYDSPSGKYVDNVVSVTQPPVGATKINTPVTDESSSPSAAPNQPTTLSPQNRSSINPSGATNTVSANNSSNGIFNTFYDASISNKLDSAAHSGNAVVMGNTSGGSAMSGSAIDQANIINVLQSSASLAGNNVATFTTNIQGNVVGDLMIDPAQLGSMQPANATVNNNANLTINSKANGQINNDINLDASSGNSTVSGNTAGGDATSGTANAVANIVNMINSITAAKSSFIGTVNIYGNLDGDILLPPSALDTLLSSNLPRATINTATISNTSDIVAQFNDTQAINNNVNAKAATGKASVSGNTIAGGAASGDANTNVTILNLTGRNVVGNDALLVFVNVLGKWVGLITNAPNGATAAALGGGITDINNTQTANIKVDNNNQINNNLALNANSGDSTVSRNTKAGNARSGDATASANIANLIDSKLSLSNWFGVLFINVFGTWNGSFGINTAAGNHPQGGMGAGNRVSNNDAAPTNGPLSYAPTHHDNSAYFTAAGNTGSGTGSYDTDQPIVSTPKVLSDINSNPTPTIPVGTHTTTTKHQNFNMVPMFGGLAGLAVLGTEKIISVRNRRK